MKPTRFTLFVVCVLAAVAAAAADLVVIDLRNRTADDILPALRPLVGRDASLSGVDYKLLVRGTPADVARIREALAVLDRAPKQLLISVRYSGAPQSDTREAGATANIDNRGSQIAVRGGSSVRTGSDSSVSRIRVLEGTSARISSGQSVPIVTAFVPTQMTGRGTGFGIATDYRELSTGFSVLPRVNGERVVLEVSAQQQRLTDSNSGNASVQRADTTLSGRLGEWIDLGGVASSTIEQQSGFGVAGGGRRVTTQTDQRSIAVKVELVH